MNVESVDLGDELRQSIEPRLHLAPVVLGAPVVRELLDGRELYALGWILDRFPVRPLCRFHALAQIDDIRFRQVDRECPDGVIFGRRTQTCWKQTDGSRRSRQGEKAT